MFMRACVCILILYPALSTSMWKMIQSTWTSLNSAKDRIGIDDLFKTPVKVEIFGWAAETDLRITATNKFLKRLLVGMRSHDTLNWRTTRMTRRWLETARRGQDT